MEYVYAAMLLHKAGKPVDEGNVTKVLEAAHVKADAAKVKALVSALSGVDIEKVSKEASVVQVAQAAAPAGEASGHKADAKHEEKKKAEDEKKSEEAAAAGLGALFG